jgi:hypothetical protein
MVITPLCGPCGRRHDPTATCLAEDPLSVFTPTRAGHQDAVDHLETVTVTSYRFHRPRRRESAPDHPNLIALMLRAHRGVSSPDHPTSFAVAAVTTIAVVAAVLALIALVISLRLH